MSSFTLKLLAIIFMTIDHIGFLFFPSTAIFRTIGRLAFPIFAFQLGVGFEHTRSKGKYIFRMLIFTIISQTPYLFFMNKAYPDVGFILNIGATLTCGLSALYCIEKFDKILLKLIYSVLIISLGIFIPMEYSWYGILTIITLYFFRKNKLMSSFMYSVLLCIYCISKNSDFNVPAILALIPLFLYNGKKGPSAKYLFYIFYPLHMLVLALIKTLI